MTHPGSVQQRGKPGRGSFWARLGLLMLFSLPVSYVGIILAVATHEIIGHGLAALLVGGSFTGFVLKWDAMGWAYAFPVEQAPEGHEIVILAAGISVTTVLGILFLAIGVALTERLFLRLTVLIFSACFLLDGVPYLFWSSLVPFPAVGDPARIIDLSGSQYVRWSFVVVGAILTVASTFVLVALLYRTAEKWIGAGIPLRPSQALIVLLLLIVIPDVVGEFMFDWDQLVPGIGLWPPFCGAGLVVSATAWIYFRPARVPGVYYPLSAGAWPTVWSWTSGAIVVLTLFVWLSDGVTWS